MDKTLAELDQFPCPTLKCCRKGLFFVWIACFLLPNKGPKYEGCWGCAYGGMAMTTHTGKVSKPDSATCRRRGLAVTPGVGPSTPLTASSYFACSAKDTTVHALYVPQLFAFRRPQTEAFKKLV